MYPGMKQYHVFHLNREFHWMSVGTLRCMATTASSARRDKSDICVQDAPYGCSVHIQQNT